MWGKKVIALLIVGFVSLFLFASSDDEVIFETGSTISYYPKDVEMLAFQDHTPLPVVCGIRKMDGVGNSSIYEVRINCAMLTNSTATGTYSADICYYLKNNDVIKMKKKGDYSDDNVSLKVRSIDWNKCVLVELQDNANYGTITPSENSF